MPARWEAGAEPSFRLSLDTASLAVQHELPDGGERGRNAIAAGLVRCGCGHHLRC